MVKQAMPTLRSVTKADIEFVSKVSTIALEEFHLAEAEGIVAQEEEELESETTFFSVDIDRKESIRQCLREERNRLLETKLDIDKQKEILRNSIHLTENEVRKLAIKAMTCKMPVFHLSQIRESKRRKQSL